MIILDENIDIEERALLEQWRIRVRHVGYDIGHKGMSDNEIISLLHQIRRITFFSRDQDFFRKYPCHAYYCLIHLDVEENESAYFIRRLLQNSEFNTQAKRMGKVIRVTSGHIYIRQLHAEERKLTWIT